MTWSEFRIKSYSFNRLKEHEARLTREISWEVHTLKYMFGSKKPPKKQAYWPIGDESTAPKVSDRAKERFRQRMAEYQAKLKERENKE